MRVQTVVKTRHETKKKLDMKDRAVFAIAVTLDVVMKSFFPFIMGYYFCKYNSLLFLGLMLLIMAFFPEIDYKNKSIKLTIRRLF